MSRFRLAAWLHVINRLLVVGIFALIVVVSLLFLTGAFQAKVSSHTGSTPAVHPLGQTPTTVAKTIHVPRIESAVGTIRPVHEAQVAGKILARITQINLVAGEHVKKGQVLVRLDDADLRARLKQAEAMLRSAQADHHQAVIELNRIRKLVAASAATPLELDRYTTQEHTTAAAVQQQRQAVDEASTNLSYATINSPMTGRVIDKQMNVGDTASPGQVLLTMYDPRRMQLIASVPEALAQHLRVGQHAEVRIESIAKALRGTISEIVPEAQTTSRSFSIKVTGSFGDHVYAGMFGRLLIPLGEQSILVIPQTAVTKVGQLNLVRVVDHGQLRRRAVMLGQTYHHGQFIEVLSGLRAGERVAVPPNASPTAPAPATQQ